MICKMFREAGFVEKLGTGLIAILDSYEERSLVDPQLIEGENYVKCILPRLQKRKEKIEPLSKLFALSAEISLEDAQRILGVSRSTATRRLNQWIRQGIIERIGKTRSTRFRKI